MSSPQSFPSREEPEQFQEFNTSPNRILSILFGRIPPPATENQQSGENIVVMIRMSSDSESLLSDILNKEGPAPASKASIEAMPAVKVTEEGTECSICLTEFEVGGEVKEMPCKHKYHSDCIEKWLGIHGSCPVCRYKMPVDEKKTEDGGVSVVDEYLVFIGRVGLGVDSGRGSESGDSSA
ncbi:hypothetical protein LguiA_017220 [Lonicera macranthoides]